MSLEISPFDRTRTDVLLWLYLLSFVRYSMSKNIATLSFQSGSIKVIESGRLPFDKLAMISYLLVLYSNFVPKSTVFEIFDLKPGLWVTPGHQNGQCRSATDDFILTFYGNYGPISYCLRDKHIFP